MIANGGKRVHYTHDTLSLIQFSRSFKKDNFLLEFIALDWVAAAADAAVDFAIVVRQSNLVMDSVD